MKYCLQIKLNLSFFILLSSAIFHQQLLRWEACNVVILRTLDLLGIDETDKIFLNSILIEHDKYRILALAHLEELMLIGDSVLTTLDEELRSLIVDLSVFVSRLRQLLLQLLQRFLDALVRNTDENWIVWLLHVGNLDLSLILIHELMLVAKNVEEAELWELLQVRLHVRCLQIVHKQNHVDVLLQERDEEVEVALAQLLHLNSQDIRAAHLGEFIQINE